MRRIHPECADSDPCDRSADTDFGLRQEADVEDEGDGKEDNDDDESDDGYSE
jgi:hypothetical protein